MRNSVLYNFEDISFCYSIGVIPTKEIVRYVNNDLIKSDNYPLLLLFFMERIEFNEKN